MKEIDIKRENFFKFIELTGVTSGELAEKTGQDRGNVNKYYNNKLAPSKSFLHEVEASYDINLLNFDEDVVKNVVITTGKIVVKEPGGVPYYDLDFVGGRNSTEIFANQRPKFFITSPDFLDAEFACNLFGQSVSNSIPSGAVVGFKEIQDWRTYFPSGEFYGIVTKNDLRTVKIVKRIKGNEDDLLLVPDPKDEVKERFEEEKIPKEFIIKMYQVVVWAQFERVVM